MTASEFNNQFDVLYNNITSNQAPGLNEYEKSVYLTKAQNELLLNRFDKDSAGNAVKKGFDESAVRQMNFANLMKTVSCSIGTATAKIDPRSIVYIMPTDIFIVINEVLYLSTLKEATAVTTSSTETTEVSESTTQQLVSNSQGIRQVVPISYDEYMRLMSKPFKEPLKWQAWRLLNSYSSANICELVLTTKDKNFYPTRTYIMRYIKKPKPIILVDLPNSFGEDVSIDGKQGTTTEGYTVNSAGNITNPCELDESTHEAILQRAVELAKIAWGGDNNQTQLEIQAGTRSE